MLFNKRGSLEISIQAIVIVVLAMTLLGLGLGFIKNMFKNITDTTSDVSEQVRQKVLDDLVQGDKKISFPKTEITIDKGSSTVLTVGIRNKGDAPLKYTMRFTAVNGAGMTAPNQALSDFEKLFQFDSTKEYELSAADASIRNIRLSMPNNVVSGSYFLTFDVLKSDGSVYDTKDFFVVVRG